MRWRRRPGQTGSVGIGIPGSLEPKSRLGKGASSTWLLGKPVEADLQAALGREIRVENDADCFAASEAVDGAGAGYNVVFAVILGSGVGAGIAVDGRAHHGPNNSGGEWGHNPLPFPDTTEIPGKPCYCGRHGCMETWVSGRAFEAQYAEHKGVELKAAEIIELKRERRPAGGLLWRRYVDRVARGLATVVNTLDPDVLVMGGGMSNVDELYDDLPPALARARSPPCSTRRSCASRHGDASGVRGAAWLWKDHEHVDIDRPLRLRPRRSSARRASWRSAISTRATRSTSQNKGPQDMASEADLNTELLIRDRLAKAFPEDAFLGEETGRTAFDDGQGIWVVDPIDGTQPFVCGMTSWCVSIAFVRGRRPAVRHRLCPGAGRALRRRRGHSGDAERRADPR